MRAHLHAADHLLADPTWADKTLCPTCDTQNTASVLDKVRANLAQYEVVQTLSANITSAWRDRAWHSLVALEAAAKTEGEAETFRPIDAQMNQHALTATQVDTLWSRRSECRRRVQAQLDAQHMERQVIEQRLPPSLVELTTKVTHAKSLKSSWALLKAADKRLFDTKKQLARTERVKRFLDSSATSFASAEANAAERRLTAVQPVCRDLFKDIIQDPVEPALIKPAGG